MDTRWIVTILIFLIISVVYLKIFEEDTRFEKILIVVYILLVCVIIYSPLIFEKNGVIRVSYPNISKISAFKLDILSKQFIFNVLITLPMGIISKIKIFSIEYILFLGIGLEFFQYILSNLFYLNRVFDINDILANTFGLIIGYFIMNRLKKAS